MRTQPGAWLVLPNPPVLEGYVLFCVHDFPAYLATTPSNITRCAFGDLNGRLSVDITSQHGPKNDGMFEMTRAVYGMLDLVTGKQAVLLLGRHDAIQLDLTCRQVRSLAQRFMRLLRHESSFVIPAERIATPLCGYLLSTSNGKDWSFMQIDGLEDFRCVGSDMVHVVMHGCAETIEFDRLVESLSYQISPLSFRTGPSPVP